MTALATIQAATDLAHLRPLAESAKGFAQAARSDRTKDAYRYQWEAFASWCESQGLPALPAAPQTVTLYLTAKAEEGKKVATLAQALAAISEAHHFGSYPSPRESAMVRETWKGIRRKLGVAPRRVAPVLVRDLRAMVSALPGGLRGLRDRALLTIGFAGALRRSELVTLRVEDVAFQDDGLVITIRRSKTDQEGLGHTVGLPFGSDPLTCPVRALREWLRTSSIAEGLIFRSVSRHGHLGEALHGRDIARIIKNVTKAAGLDSSTYSGHSLRAGLATSAAHAGKADRSIMNQGRWKSRAMVDRYVRDANLFRDNAASGIGL